MLRAICLVIYTLQHSVSPYHDTRCQRGYLEDITMYATTCSVKYIEYVYAFCLMYTLHDMHVYACSGDGGRGHTSSLDSCGQDSLIHSYIRYSCKYAMIEYLYTRGMYNKNHVSFLKQDELQYQCTWFTSRSIIDCDICGQTFIEVTPCLLFLAVISTPQP